MPLNMIHDLKEANGRTIKENNLDRHHQFAIGALVEIRGGIRLIVARHTRDCDGTPLYDLSTRRCKCAEEDKFLETHLDVAVMERNQLVNGHFESCDWARRYGPFVNHGEDGMTLVELPPDGWIFWAEGADNSFDPKFTNNRFTSGTPERNQWRR